MPKPPEVEGHGSFATIKWSDGAFSVVSGGEPPSGSKYGQVVEVQPQSVGCRGTDHKNHSGGPGDEHFQDSVKILKKSGKKLTRYVTRGSGE